MRVQKRIPWLFSLGVVLVAMTLWGTRAGADVTSDRPGSIVMWPKVIADGTRDTILTLTNTGNVTAYAHCEYVQGTGFCSLSNDFCSLTTPDSCPEIVGAGPNVCNISWQTEDFGLILTRQQPTMWRVSTGRIENLLLPADGECADILGSPLRQSCPGLFEIGMVPPAPLQANSPAEFGGFRGEVRCVQVASDLSTPIGGDALKGEAIIEGVEVGTDVAPLVSEYNSINILNISTPGDNVLELNGLQYNACPEAVDIIHYARGASDISANSLGATCTTSNCVVQTEITLVPCRADFVDEIGSAFNVDFRAEDEFESLFSREIPFTCWANADLATLGFSNVNGATFMRTRATSTGSGLCIAGSNVNTFCRTDADCGTAGVCGPASGIVALVEEFHTTDRTSGEADLIGSAAANVHSVDANHDGSLERLGHCRGMLSTTCSVNGDCPAGFCRIATTTPCTTNAQCAGDGDFCDRCMNDEITFDPDFAAPPPPPE